VNVVDPLCILVVSSTTLFDSLADRWVAIPRDAATRIERPLTSQDELLGSKVPNF
jgi:hypothetical protein